MDILVRNNLQKTPVYDAYWHFASERQKVYFKRLVGESMPWTDDPVIEKHKFTNTYRALDKVSQYLIQNIIQEDERAGLPNREKIFRILAFKIFNKIETWELLENILGKVLWDEYSFSKYDEILGEALSRGGSIYSAAYIMASGSKVFSFSRKHQNHLKLLEMIMKDELFVRASEYKSMAQLYEKLLSYPMIGPFLAYQYATDINYSDMTRYSEEEFVVAGPGAKDGIVKCFVDKGTYTDEDIIHFMMDRQELEFERRGYEFLNLFGRNLKLIDCQNIFCEVGKYARVTHPQFKDKSGRTRIKQLYHYSGPLQVPSFPNKWGLGENVKRFLSKQS